MNTPLIIRTAIDAQTVYALDVLIELARDGVCIGLAYAAFMPRQRFLAKAVGEAHRSPTFARGALCALDDELRDIAERKAMRNTTL